jgi:hypothetical protein
MSTNYNYPTNYCWCQALDIPTVQSGHRDRLSHYCLDLMFPEPLLWGDVTLWVTRWPRRVGPLKHSCPAVSISYNLIQEICLVCQAWVKKGGRNFLGWASNGAMGLSSEAHTGKGYYFPSHGTFFPMIASPCSPVLSTPFWVLVS